MTSLHDDRSVRQANLPRIWAGVVVDPAPSSTSDLLTVVIPDLHPDLEFQEVRWSGSPPELGDDVLIVFDNNREPWVVDQWPNRTTTGGGGVAGPGGTYIFTQSSPAITWVILHNLVAFPSVTVVNTGDNEVIPDIHYDSVNQITLTFAVATSGKAYLN